MCVKGTTWSEPYRPRPRPNESDGMLAGVSDYWYQLRERTTQHRLRGRFSGWYLGCSGLLLTLDIGHVGFCRAAYWLRVPDVGPTTPSASASGRSRRASSSARWPRRSRGVLTGVHCGRTAAVPRSTIIYPAPRCSAARRRRGTPVPGRPAPSRGEGVPDYARGPNALFWQAI
jgi:hypothetical protein